MCVLGKIVWSENVIFNGTRSLQKPAAKIVLFFLITKKIFNCRKKLKNKLLLEHCITKHKADIGTPVQMEILIAVESYFPETQIETGVHRYALAERQLRPNHTRYSETGTTVVGLVLGHSRHVGSPTVHIKQREFPVFNNGVQTLDFHKVELCTKFDKRLKYFIELKSITSCKIEK